MSSNIPPSYTDEEQYWIDHAKETLARYEEQDNYYKWQDRIAYIVVGAFVLGVVLLIICIIFAIASCGQGVTVTYS